ncbi:MAG TPA: anion transporter [Phycisphaerales bacterium]|nr:anion transporter [Phycisphaerales bacterium]
MSTATPSEHRSGGRLPRWGALAAGPALALGVYLLCSMGAAPGLEEPGRRTLALLVWMASWWLLEAIPLAATALLPIAAGPLMGVLSVGEATAPYANKVIFLFLGGFMLALAMERSGLHKRVALMTVALTGTRPRMVVAGFMLATGFMSMWMSNTAAAVMMLPIGMSIVALVRERTSEDSGPLGRCVMLGIAYAASIGGVATPIGTPPNAILIGFLRARFGFEVSFLEWMVVGVPTVALMLPVAWLLLTRVVFPIRGGRIPGGAELIRAERAALGSMSRAERTVAGVFVLTVGAWVLRDPLAMLAPSWEWWLVRMDDSVIAIAAAVALFVIPVRGDRWEAALDWETAERLPWGVLILFGGGLSLAAAVSKSGLDVAVGNQAGFLGGAPVVVVILALTGVIVFVTEVTSNTATATIFFPLLAGAAPALGIDPVLLLTPVCLGVSMAFMLPMATPPNALVFGTGLVTIRQMAWAGLWLNFISIGMSTLIAMTVVRATLSAQFIAERGAVAQTE